MSKKISNNGKKPSISSFAATMARVRKINPKPFYKTPVPSGGLLGGIGFSMGDRKKAS
jgi:hypothetical protein